MYCNTFFSPLFLENLVKTHLTKEKTIYTSKHLHMILEKRSSEKDKVFCGNHPLDSRLDVLQSSLYETKRYNHINLSFINLPVKWKINIQTKLY